MKHGLALLALLFVSAASPPPSWLDAKALANWNIAGAPLPSGAAAKDPDLAPGGRCAAETRAAWAPEDRRLVRKGWKLIGPYQRYGRTAVLLATSSTDGMCRPNGYQGFVFVNGAFAGTLAPRLMDSRTDGALGGAGVELDSENRLSATFLRYADSDPLCCPQASTSVSYTVAIRAGQSLVRPLSAQTNKNP